MNNVYHSREAQRYIKKKKKKAEEGSYLQQVTPN